MKETKIIRRFREQLHKLYPNMFFWKVRDAKGITGKLNFDGIFIIKGKVWCFEAKSGKNKLTPYQKVSLERAKTAGAFILVIREDFSDALSYILAYFHGDSKHRRKAIRYFRRDVEKRR